MQERVILKKESYDKIHAEIDELKKKNNKLEGMNHEKVEEIKRLKNKLLSLRVDIIDAVTLYYSNSIHPELDISISTKKLKEKLDLKSLSNNEIWISNLDGEIKEAFRELSARPELLNTININIKLTD